LARFDDYHRTVIGYHGTGLSTALRIVNRVEGFRWSRRAFDWLGHGIYFWEHAPRQARDWARLRQRQLARKKNPTADDLRRMNEPIAVVASMIRLGFCFDLLDPDNVEYLVSVHDRFRETLEMSGVPLPQNHRKYRRLDCAVFEHAYRLIDELPDHPSVDSTRGVYVPAGGDRRVWGSSWISRDTHIQLCVRNPACILGTWLHYPTNLEIEDVQKAIENAEVGVERDHPQGAEESPGDARGEAHRSTGEVETDNPGTSRTGQEEMG
jgi:hypothetical protein